MNFTSIWPNFQGIVHWGYAVWRPTVGVTGYCYLFQIKHSAQGNSISNGHTSHKSIHNTAKICYSLFLSQGQIWRLFQPINTHSISQRKDNYLRGLEGVIWGEMNGNQKYTSSIGTIRWTHNCCLPMKHVLCHRPCKTIQINVCQRSIIMGLT